jgi:hypothetical protein
MHNLYPPLYNCAAQQRRIPAPSHHPVALEQDNLPAGRSFPVRQ